MAGVTYRRPTSSFCSARIGANETAGRLGKMPTTSVRRRISLLRRSESGARASSSSGKLEKARTSGLRPVGDLEPIVELEVTLSSWACTSYGGGLLVDGADHGGHPGLALGTRVSRLVMKWVRHRCQLAPPKTAAMVPGVPDAPIPPPSTSPATGDEAWKRRPWNVRPISPARHRRTTPGTTILRPRLRCPNIPMSVRQWPTNAR